MEEGHLMTGGTIAFPQADSTGSWFGLRVDDGRRQSKIGNVLRTATMARAFVWTSGRSGRGVRSRVRLLRLGWSGHSFRV